VTAIVGVLIASSVNRMNGLNGRMMLDSIFAIAISLSSACLQQNYSCEWRSMEVSEAVRAANELDQQVIEVRGRVLGDWKSLKICAQECVDYFDCDLGDKCLTISLVPWEGLHPKDQMLIHNEEWQKISRHDGRLIRIVGRFRARELSMLGRVPGFYYLIYLVDENGDVTEMYGASKGILSPGAEPED
jgi:hypothetical protein